MAPEVGFEGGRVSVKGNIQVVSKDHDEIDLYVDNPDAARILQERIGEKAIEFKSDAKGNVNGHGMAGVSYKEKTPQTLKEVVVNPLIAGTYH